MAGGFSLVCVNSSFSNCSSEYGGAVYLVISGDPSEIEMSDVIFKENSASKGGNTLYVVWKSTSWLTSEQFSSFLTCDEEEAKVETWKGKVATLGEFVSSGGSEGEGENGYVYRDRDIRESWDSEDCSGG